MAVVFSLIHILPVVSSSPSPEDWASGVPYQLSDDNRADTFTSAYINVSREDEHGWRWDKTEVGRYGGGHVGAAFGTIVHVTSDIDSNDHTGCHLPFRSTRTDKLLPQSGEPWIALIVRGRCNFEAKVENAYKSNASGVIVYNDRDSVSLDKMKLTSDTGRK